MPLSTVAGAWGDGCSGGCPKFDSWPLNPQYRLLTSSLPSPPSPPSPLRIELRCHDPSLPVGFLVLRPSGRGSGRFVAPKLHRSAVVYKSTWRPTTPAKPMAGDLTLPPDDQGYVLIPCTHEPGGRAGFELRLSSDSEFTIEQIPEEGGLQDSTRRAAPAVPTPAPRATGVECGECIDSNVPSIASEGQGLSAQQLKEVEAMVNKALAQSASSPGGKYQDAAFPASKASLWLNGTSPSTGLLSSPDLSDPVVAWRRPEEWSSSPRLFPSPGDATGIVAGPLPNLWLLAACNIVSGDIDVISRTFVDSSHADKGFYVVRFFVDDPSSDDDWVVVLIDDRIPCGSDARPCFARTPSEVIWVSLIEKAFAKFRGSYEAMSSGSVEEGLLYLTGGLSMDMVIPREAAGEEKGGGVGLKGKAELDALWADIMGFLTTAHVIGCEVRAAGEVEGLAETGLIPNIPYAVLTGGDLPCGRMLRLRTFDGYSEWRGKWADDDPAWNNRLRNMMQYSDSNDGTFWMCFEDFCHWFNTLFVCRRADDQWTRMTVRSSWCDTTAGGCCPNFVTWRTNPQWLLRIRKPTRLAISLTLPPSSSVGGVADRAICIQILQGNAGVDSRRRRLILGAEEEMLVSEPRFATRVMYEVNLQPADAPYVLMPCAFSPGHESQFTLVVRSDDCDDDGNPDFGFEPVSPKNDWRQATLDGSWPAPSSGANLASFPQFQLHVSIPGRFFIFVDQLGVTTDMRLEDGVQSETVYPSVGLALGLQDDAFASLQESLGKVEPEPRDGAVYECRLVESETPYVIIPFIEDLAGSLARYPQLRFRICVYSDVEFHLGDKPQTRLRGGVSSYSHTKHWGVPPHPVSRKLPIAEHTAFCNCTCDPVQRECPMHNVYKRLQAIHVSLDAQLKFLSTLM